MYPSWGNFAGQPSQNYGPPVPRKPPGDAQAPGFGGFEASPGGSVFSSLQEQHLQQMQQLQMLHQKQLQSVLNHASHANPYNAGHSGGYSSGTPWHPEPPGPPVGGVGAQSYYKQDETSQPMKAPTAPSQVHQQPPPPQSQPLDPQAVPPSTDSSSLKPPENGAPLDTKKQPSTTEDDKSLPLQVVLWSLSAHFFWLSKTLCLTPLNLYTKITQPITETLLK